ncbi:hypothetical protein ONZ45_g13139 [Pleurotus djamor]|nr:hypothetical protein ONZ45_g13139 [Pleurotus djamor]
MTPTPRALDPPDILPSKVDIEASLLRPLFFGLMVTALLYGVVNLQVYRYFIRYTKDPRSEKLAVVLLCCITTASTAFVLYSAYATLVQSWANPADLLDPMLSRQAAFSKLEAVCNDCVVLVSSKLHWTFHAAIALVIVGDVVAVISVVIQLSTRRLHFVDITHNGSWDRVLYTLFLALTFADLFMALAICYSLRKSSSEFSRTQSRISMLIKYTLSSGLLTSFIDLAVIITYVVSPQSFVFYSLALPLPCLYVASYLALLNTRQAPSHVEVINVVVHSLNSDDMADTPERDDEWIVKSLFS